MRDRRRIDRVNRWYVDAIFRAGGLPVILPTLPPEEAEEMLSGLHGLLSTGGGDVDPWLYGEEPAPEVYDVDPPRDQWELALLQAVGDEMPVLGVCRGVQLLNVRAGGSLIQHLPDVTDEPHRLRERDREPVHCVDVAPDSLLADILGQTRVGVNSIHHQAIAEVGKGLTAVAWASDGIVEAVERTDGAPVMGVQWHPESLIDLPPHGRLFLWLTRAAARHPGLRVPEGFVATSRRSGGLGHVVDDVA